MRKRIRLHWNDSSDYIKDYFGEYTKLPSLDERNIEKFHRMFTMQYSSPPQKQLVVKRFISPIKYIIAFPYNEHCPQQVGRFLIIKSEKPHLPSSFDVYIHRFYYNIRSTYIDIYRSINRFASSSGGCKILFTCLKIIRTSSRLMK